MASSELDRAAILGVRPLELAGYLRAHGWQEARRLDGAGAVWTAHDAGGEYEVLLPLTPELADYPSRLRQALETLAAVEERPLLEVWQDVTTSSADVVRLALKRPDPAGTLPLDDLVRMLEGLRELALAAACSAVRPKPLHPGHPPVRAVEYVRRLRLAPPPGAHVVLTLISPVPQGLTTGGDSALNGASEPFERRANLLLARGIVAAEEAARQAAATGRLEAFERGVAQGVSANLCQALMRLAGDLGRADLVFTFTWSATRPVPGSAPRRVLLPADALPLIEEAGRLLRETSVQEEFVLRGFVVRLERPEGAPAGTAWLLTFLDGQARRVEVELRGPAYDLAIRAHQERQPLACTGELTRAGNRLVLLNPRQVEVEPVEALP